MTAIVVLSLKAITNQLLIEPARINDQNNNTVAAALDVIESANRLSPEWQLWFVKMELKKFLDQGNYRLLESIADILRHIFESNRYGCRRLNLATYYDTLREDLVESSNYERIVTNWTQSDSDSAAIHVVLSDIQYSKINWKYDSHGDASEANKAALLSVITELSRASKLTSSEDACIRARLTAHCYTACTLRFRQGARQAFDALGSDVDYGTWRFRATKETERWPVGSIEDNRAWANGN